MSRPPRPAFRESTAGDGSAFASRGQFLPIEFAEMVALQGELAQEEARLGTTDASTDARGDFARTLFELSALVAHTLGLYQDLYGREAFLTTAQTERSLVLHARRLGYAPDQGLAASGFVVLTIGPGLRGTLPARFAVASSPRGVVKAQTFETLDDLEVDAARNEARPADRERPAAIAFANERGSFFLAGRSLPLRAGGIGMLMRGDEAVADARWDAVTIVEISEDESRDATRVVVDLLSGTSSMINATEPLGDTLGAPTFRFFALPKEQLHRFGWDADPINFPSDAVNTANAFSSPEDIDGVEFGYDVTRDSGGGLRAKDAFLSGTVRSNLAGGWVVAPYANSIEPLKVVEQGTARVALRRTGTVSYAALDANGVTVTQTVTVESQISGTVTYLRLQTHGALVLDRWFPRLPSPLYADWQFEAPVLAAEPNPAPIPSPLVVDADYGDFRPGGVVVFETLDGSGSQAREVQKLTVLGSGQTELHTIDLTPAPPGGWTLDNLKVSGNVARVTHGETHEEVLGGSDGVTMFLRFELKKAPLTLVPGADGGEAAIDVFVNDVAWTRVADFFLSGPHDRHYRLEFDDEHVANVVFGNGLRGAIPPSGFKNIRVVYRHGLGAQGNVDAVAASRIKKAHPLVTAAANRTPLIGGADAASLADLQRQATRYIRTFERAVSVQDYADLALLFPGVARAAARPHDAGIQVIVATSDGGQPPLDQVRTFLDARRDDALSLEVLGPDPVDVWLDLIVEHDSAMLTENVKRAVQDALVGADGRGPGLFTFPAREFGQAAHLSEVYERVAGPRGVEGVTFVDVTRFRIGNVAGVYDVLQINARQWLRLQAQNLTIQITPGAAA
jgi:hypothetical protein